ncbi:LegC2/C7 family Dot/Icm T4SS effector [Legionella fallonii]|uniref:Inclusion membrane protein A n=1 Tax=Legionella fallonii LLAP-10 TaxID=1212491 RepID=A0A098G873_9GAMM|nr:LegC2/C7 family Dot/Icm T4SS effector [Legionella fallonii]CEG57665.1 Inclusion membrane protein A [Legionella fallonii LLAP-10]
MSTVEKKRDDLFDDTTKTEKNETIAEIERLQQASSSPTKPGEDVVTAVKAETTPDLLPGKNSLESIIEAKQQVSQVKASLGTIIDTMAQNPSIFNRAATYYGELPMWKKILIGMGISIPTLALGVFAEIGVLLVVGGVTAVAYTATGIVLEDHHHCNINIADRLKKGIISLADVLELTIKALDKIGQRLAEEVEKFKAENLKLVNKVSELADQVESLSSQVELFIEIEKMLRQSKTNLEETAASLKKSTTDQSALLKRNQEELERVTKDYERSQKQLSEKVDELKEVKVQMSKEVEKVNQLSTTLAGTVSTLSRVVTADKKQKEALESRLKNCLEENQQDLGSVVVSLNETEDRLEKGREEFELATSRFNHLLERHDQLFERMEGLYARFSEERMVSKQSTDIESTSNLSTHVTHEPF